MFSRLNATQAVAWLALFVSLGGTVYAAGKIDGRTIRKGSIPANRVKPDSLTGAQVNEAGLATVPRAARAAVAARAPGSERAVLAGSAAEATRALRAEEAATATRAAEAEVATRATRSDEAGSALALGGVPASGYQQLCADGTIKAALTFDPQVVPPTTTGFNCVGQGGFRVTSLGNGTYRVFFDDITARTVFASTRGLNSAAAVKSNGGVPHHYLVRVFSTRTDALLPGEPFTVLVF